MTETSPFTKFIRVYQESQVIFEEGSSGNEMYIVRSGTVKLTTTKPGRELLLATLGSGDFFGEMALCDAEPRTASATSVEDGTEVIALDQEKFLYLVSQQPAFALTIMHSLCQRIRERWELYEKMPAKGALPATPRLKRTGKRKK